MVNAYKNASTYADKAIMQVAYRVGIDPQPLTDMGNYVVAMARPNKLRTQVYGGIVVCDGRQLWGSVADVRSQVLQLPAPAELTVESIYPDHILADSFAQGPTQTFSWLPLQLVLLLADDPLKTFLFQAEEPELLSSEKIEQDTCYRVRIKRADGTAVFWIDQKTHLLRRFECPTDKLRTMLAQGHRVARDQIQGLSVSVEFNDAQLNGEVDPRAFEFQAPPEVKLVERFVPNDLLRLGQPAPDFSFVDLEGNPVTRQSVAGKIAVVDLWATWCGPCRQSLPELEEVYQKYKDNGKLAFLAVSLDKPEIENDKLLETFTELRVNVPIVRDPEQKFAQALNIEGIPTMFVLGPDGIVAHYKTGGGGPPGVPAMQLADKLDKLLAGENVTQETLRNYDQNYAMQKKQFDGLLQKCVQNDLFVHPMFMEPEIPRAEIAERTEPQTLGMTRLFSCTDLKAPGNLLVVDRPGGPPRLLVVNETDSNEANSIAEIGLDGKVVANTPLKVPQGEPVLFLRTAAGADGRRYFVASAMGVQRLHLLDENFNLLLSYPKDDQGSHAGIADVRLADLDGDGTLELAVGYFGIVGVQGVSLEGTRVWANRSVSQVLRLAVLGPDAERRRNLLCMNNHEGVLGTLVLLDATGNRVGDIVVPNRSLGWITAADLNADGQPELCGLVPVEGGNVVAVGLNLQGQELWSYPLPRGVHEHQIEAVTSGNLLGTGPDQWILAAADGSIHVIAADGELLDRFNYGAVLTGLATAEWDGRPVLLVATPQGVDAWQVAPPGIP